MDTKRSTFYRHNSYQVFKYSNKNLLCEEKAKNVGLTPATQRRVGV